MKCNTIELASGEFAGIGIVEISMIPSITILKDSYPQGTDIEEEYKRDFGNLLTEIYQGYNNFSSYRGNSEVSIELSWITEEVANQPFRANIKLFLILR